MLREEKKKRAGRACHHHATELEALGCAEKAPRSENFGWKRGSRPSTVEEAVQNYIALAPTGVRMHKSTDGRTETFLYISDYILARYRMALRDPMLYYSTLP